MVKACVKSVGNFIRHWGPSQFRQRANRLVGLDIGSSAITLVQLEKSGQKFSLTRFGFRWLEEGLVIDDAILDRQRLVTQLQDLVGENGLAGQPVVLAVSGPSVMVKRLKISGVQSADLDEHLQWEGHRYISHPLDDVCLDHQVCGINGEDELDILLVVAKRNVVEDRQLLASEAGLDPVGCDVAGLALANMASLAGADSYASHLNVNLGSGGCTIVALDRGMPLFIRDASWEDDLPDESTRIFMDRTDGGHASAEKDKFGESVLHHDVQHLAREIRRNLNFMYEVSSAAKVENIQLSGAGATPALCETLTRELSIPVALLIPFQGIRIRDLHLNQDHLYRFGSLAGVAVGLAARSDCYV
ncbi:MAG: type IV pilus assembly protein PilM [Nitrospirota bacterium]|nr:type IV pilus assembly protein PilM [Nitrospirota bacterium]